MSTIPDSQEALNDLSQLVPMVYQAIEAATQKTREFFDKESSPIDSWLAPNLVRYYAKRFLDDAGQSVEYEREELSNNGLCLNYGNYQLRIWKSDDGELPVPGPSQVRQKFFQQLSLNMSIPAERTNLAILWQASSTYSLIGLFLSCPKAGGISRTSVEEYWTVGIPHPALSTTIAAQSQDQFDEYADLPISKQVGLQAEQAE